jgi:hypothetical protein
LPNIDVLLKYQYLKCSWLKGVTLSEGKVEVLFFLLYGSNPLLPSFNTGDIFSFLFSLCGSTLRCLVSTLVAFSFFFFKVQPFFRQVSTLAACSLCTFFFFVQ